MAPRTDVNASGGPLPCSTSDCFTHLRSAETDRSRSRSTVVHPGVEERLGPRWQLLFRLSNHGVPEKSIGRSRRRVPHEWHRFGRTACGSQRT